MLKSEVLKQFFQAEREYCNQMVASIHHQSQLIDTDDLNWFFSNCLDSVMIQLDGVSNQISFPVALAGFKQGLELASLNWFKNERKRKVILQTWTEFYPQIISIIQQEPNKVFSETSNALNHLMSFQNHFPDQWLAKMSKVAAHIDNNLLLKQIGLIYAWLVGLAHYRESALKQLNLLPANIYRTLFDLSDSIDLEHHHDQLKINRWFPTIPVSNLIAPPPFIVQKRIGCCSLLGGDFPSPPEVFESSGQIFVRSGDLWWLLYVDAFGSSLLPYDTNVIQSHTFSNIQTHKFAVLKKTPGLKDINKISSVARLSDSIVLTSKETFAVIILSVSNASNIKAKRQ